MSKGFGLSKAVMKKIILLIHFVLLLCCSNAQNTLLDTLQKELAHPKDDTDKLFALSRLAVTYTYSKPDSAIIYAQQAIALAKKMKSDFALSFALKAYGGLLSQTGNYPQAIYFTLESLKLAEKAN